MKGRLVIDMEPSLALNLTYNITGLSFQDVKDSMVMACVNEINNTVAGDAVTKINNSFNYP